MQPSDPRIESTTKEHAQERTTPFSSYELPTVVDDVLFIAIPSARSDSPKYQRFDLCEFYLPPTLFCQHPIPLTDRPELISILQRALHAYGLRISPDKSWHQAMANATRTLCKLFEYSWLNGLYSISDWTTKDFEDLSQLLAKGGWAKALRLQERTRDWVQEIGREGVLAVLPSVRSRADWSLGEKFNQALGTNVRSRELRPAKDVVSEYLLGPKSSAESKPADAGPSSATSQARRKPGREKTGRSFELGMGESQLRQELNWLNLLGDILENPPVDFSPYPSTFRLSKELGRQGGRTDNLAPDHVAKLLVEAKWWIDELAPHALALCTALSEPLLQSNGQGVDSKEQIANLMACDTRLAIENLLGCEIRTVTGNNSTPHSSATSVIGSLYTACFIVLAFLNARRKDELIHRKYGLSAVCLTPVNEAIDLYKCEFYIEKTFRAYVDYFIASLSVKAIRVLEQFSSVAREIRASFSHGAPRTEDVSEEREDKLFELPRLNNSHGLLGYARWYAFEPDGLARDFLRRALGENITVRVAPHMFRRGYALIFHYRYEMESMHALSYQLGHFDLTRAWRYVTDEADGATGPAAKDYARGRGPADRALNADLLGIHEEVRAVGEDRLRELVSQVVANSGRPNSGFQRLVQRFHQLLLRSQNFKELAAEEQAERITKTLIERGHTSHPLPHTNCMAARGRRNRGAKCFSSKTGGISRQDADALVCGTCPYGNTQKGHLKTIELDLERQQRRLANLPDHSSVTAVKLRASVANVAGMLRLQRQRLGIAATDAATGAQT